MRKMKKTVVTVACAGLLVVGSVAATFAYLQDSDKVVNTFTVGNVDIALDEANVDENGVEYSENNMPDGGLDNEGRFLTTDDGSLIKRVNSNIYKLIPGMSYVKDPTVTVKAGSEDSYVRAQVTVSNYSALLEGFKGEEGYIVKEGDKDVLLIQRLIDGWNNDVWQYVKCTPAANDASAVYEFLYVGDKANDAGIVPAVDESASDLKLEPLFTHVVIPGALSADAYESLADVEITVAAQAVQAAGFQDGNGNGTAADEAFAAAFDN